MEKGGEDGDGDPASRDSVMTAALKALETVCDRDEDWTPTPSPSPGMPSWVNDSELQMELINNKKRRVDDLYNNTRQLLTQGPVTTSNQTACNQTQPNQSQSNQSQLSQPQISQTQISQTQISQSQANQSQLNQTPPNDKNDNRNNLNRNKNRFNNSDMGPFFIYAEYKSGSGDIGKIHPIALGKRILNQLPELSKNISQISSLGRNRIKITVENYITANQLLDNKLFENLNIEVYIPSHVLFREGVIKYIDPTLSENEILQDVESPVRIEKVRRIQRKIDNKLVPTQTVILTFRGHVLPESILISKYLCKVLPYVTRVMQCFGCYRFGHTKSQCRSTIHCDKCQDKHNPEYCSKAPNPVCVNCKQSHSSFDKKCPAYIEQQQIRQVMAYNNKTYSEAKFASK